MRRLKKYIYEQIKMNYYKKKVIIIKNKKFLLINILF